MFVPGVTAEPRFYLNSGTWIGDCKVPNSRLLSWSSTRNWWTSYYLWWFNL